MAAIYIHIPFCINKCRYCDFYSVKADTACIKRYVNALCREFILKQDYSLEISSLYIGGGTPSILTQAEISALLDHARLCFNLTKDCEITIEANPATITYDSLALLNDMGVNRLSLGIQSLNEAELSALGRLHNSTQALSALSDAQRAGIKNISVDLIYGIPGQSASDWLNTLKTIIDLNPQHISTYELTLVEGTELYILALSGTLSMADEEVIENMYFDAIDTLNNAGYQHYEISNFALPGFQCRHNINYWNRGVYVGLGAGAHSFDVRTRTANVKDIERYIDFLNKQSIAVDEVTDINDEEALRESIFLGLRMTEGIERVLLQDKEETLKNLQEQGLIAPYHKRVRLTRKGLLLSNEVILRLMG